MSPAPSRSCQSHLTTREMSPSENSGCSTTAGFVPPWCPAPWHRQESPPSTARPHSTAFETRLSAPGTRLSSCRPSPEHRLFSQKHAVQMACPPPESFGNRNIVDAGGPRGKLAAGENRRDRRDRNIIAGKSERAEVIGEAGTCT